MARVTIPRTLAIKYALTRALAEAAEKRGDEAEAARLAREYQRLTNQIIDRCKRAVQHDSRC